MPTFHQLLTLSNTEATEVTPGKNHSGLDVTLQNVNETAIIYVGNSNVTAESYGFRMQPGDAFSVELNPRDQLFVISDTNEASCAVLRVFLEDV